MDTLHLPSLHRVLQLARPDHGLEWEEAVRYLTFREQGYDQWARMVEAGTPARLSTLGYVSNLDNDFPTLEPVKRERLWDAIQRGVMEYPIVGLFHEGMECIGGATRIAGLTMLGVDPIVWVVRVNGSLVEPC